MSSELFGIVELSLIFGPVIGFAVYELIKTRRDLARIKSQKPTANNTH